jgi:hypothetical protein
MTINTKTLNMLFFLLFLLLSLYLYMFDIPDLTNFGKIALVIVSLRLLMYWILPSSDLVHTRTTRVYKQRLVDGVESCAVETGTNIQFQSCVQSLLDH